MGRYKEALRVIPANYGAIYAAVERTGGKMVNIYGDDGRFDCTIRASEERMYFAQLGDWVVISPDDFLTVFKDEQFRAIFG